MRIRHISVKNLFGIFDHEIPLNAEERITIIYGPNGFGKTFTLTLVNELFNPGYDDFYRIPFSEITVVFDNDTTLGLIKRKMDTGDELVFEYRKSGSKHKTFRLEPLRPPDVPFSLSIIEREIPELKRVGPLAWLHIPSDEILTLPEVLQRFEKKLPEIKKNEPEWYRALKEAIEIRFIRTERLLLFSDSHHAESIHAVNEYAKELQDKIEKKLAEYATLSQSLDRTFPLRLVQRDPSAQLTLDELKKQLHKLERKRSRLMNAGLLDREGLDLGVLDHADESNWNILSVYIEDVEKKLRVFDDLTDKIELLIRIVNSRFLQKSMEISRREGFVFTASDGRKLRPENLSSGEQHVVVLLYELLFRVKPDSLILIDEPELSLHVFWQQQFIRDLQDIIRLAGFDVLIATHSPQIIHDRWDLAVELKGPGNEAVSHSS